MASRPPGIIERRDVWGTRTKEQCQAARGREFGDVSRASGLVEVATPASCELGGTVMAPTAYSLGMDEPPYGKQKAGLELLAASARADIGEMRVFLNVLAAKLSDMLPGHVVVEREEGIFRRRQSVRALRIRLDHRVYELQWTGTDLEARLAHEVRGVVAKPQTVQLNEWTTTLQHHLGERARKATRARDALNRLLT